MGRKIPRIVEKAIATASAKKTFYFIEYTYKHKHLQILFILEQFIMDKFKTNEIRTCFYETHFQLKRLIVLHG